MLDLDDKYCNLSQKDLITDKKSFIKFGAESFTFLTEKHIMLPDSSLMAKYYLKIIIISDILSFNYLGFQDCYLKVFFND